MCVKLVKRDHGRRARLGEIRLGGTTGGGGVDGTKIGEW